MPPPSSENTSRSSVQHSGNEQLTKFNEGTSNSSRKHEKGKRKEKKQQREERQARKSQVHKKKMSTGKR